MLRFTTAIAALTTVPVEPEQPRIETRHRAVLNVDRLEFCDANGNGALDPYEDWRLRLSY